MLKAYFLLFIVLLSACSPLSVQVPQSADYLGSVERYLVENIGIASFGGQVFCSYETLDMKQEDAQVDAYVWALCQEYYMDDHSLELGTGSSLPVALHLQKTGNEYQLLSYEVPKDGMGYWPSIQAIFPTIAIERMCEGDASCYNQRAEKLVLENEQKAREFYKSK